MGKKKVIAILIILAISIVAILIQWDTYQKGEANKVEKASSTVFVPLQSFFTGVGKSISGTWRSFTKIATLEEGNKKLQTEIYALREEQEKYNRAIDENKTLRKLLDISRHQKGKVIAAEVIARNPDNWFQSIKLNKGFKHGVKKNMVAISAEGLVGRVVSVSKYTSKVRLIFNEKSAVPSQVVSSGALGVVYGEGRNTCRMKYIEADAEVKVGDKIITSRLSRIYPPGKIIGEVSRIYGVENILYKSVQIKAAVHFNNLEYVLLVEKK
ncbi:MAG: rod shape-determining protein MreC [Candidatus Eremiobacteraeota bacterium]|nr:rod shape-determining protein MreC [Candidatus Eremiobacteraeota bacterium]